jgi:hypothetical protein
MFWKPNLTTLAPPTPQSINCTTASNGLLWLFPPRNEQLNEISRHPFTHFLNVFVPLRFWHQTLPFDLTLSSLTLTWCQPERPAGQIVARRRVCRPAERVPALFDLKLKKYAPPCDELLKHSPPLTKSLRRGGWTLGHGIWRGLSQNRRGRPTGWSGAIRRSKSLHSRAHPSAREILTSNGSSAPRPRSDVSKGPAGASQSSNTLRTLY